MEVRNFINGNFVDSFSKQNIRVVNPADQTDVGFIDEALDDEIEFDDEDPSNDNSRL